MDTISKLPTADHPTLSPLSVGSTLKVLEVTGSAGMSMPSHHSTDEAALLVKSGEALLSMDGNQHFLKSGDTFQIPAGKLHSLAIVEDFKAVVVMPVKSEIIFDPASETAR